MTNNHLANHLVDKIEMRGIHFVQGTPLKLTIADKFT